MSTRRIAAAVAAAALALAGLGGTSSAFHKGRCTVAGATGTEANSVTPSQVEDGKITRHKLVVPKGSVGLFHVRPTYGDLDIMVCKKGKRGHVYYGHNMFDDGMHAPDANVPCPAGLCTGDNLYEWGPPLKPGTYRLDIKACCSSKDGDGCDYSGDIAGQPGAFDPIPAIPYLLMFATQ